MPRLVTPNEKTTEILFNRFFMQSFNLGEILMLSPSSRQEFREGYDGRVVGTSIFREVYLQFKRPRYIKGSFRLTLTPHQHSVLKKRPAGSAFYVAHGFRNLRELCDTQRNVSQASSFLKHFVLVDVSELSMDCDSILYTRNDRMIPGGTKWASQGQVRRLRRATDRGSKSYMTGLGFLAEFKQSRVGARVLLPRTECEGEVTTRDAIAERSSISFGTQAEVFDPNTWQPSTEELEVAAKLMGTKDQFGSILRAFV